MKLQSLGARDDWNSKLTVSELITSIKQCGKLKDLEHGRRLHLRAQQAGLHTNKYVASVLITMYSRCRYMAFARQVFDELLDRDTVTWNSLILGHVDNRESASALDVFARMDCEPSSATFVAVLKAFGGLPLGNASEKVSCLEKVIAIHKQVKDRRCDTNVIVASSLMGVYSRCGSLVFAREIFDEMENRDAVAWNTLMMGYVDNGDFLVALEIFTCMDCEPSSVSFVAAIKACGSLASQRKLKQEFCLEKGISIHKRIKELGVESDVTVSNALVDMYSKLSKMKHARRVFNGMISKNVISWTSLISGYVSNEKPLVAMDLFATMDSQPDAFAYVASFKACGDLASANNWMRIFCLETGMAFHKEVKEFGLETNIILGNTLVEMYSRLGNMSSAREVFNGMSTRNVFTWTCLIQGYLAREKFKVGLAAFRCMECRPSSVTYVAALKACAGLASETNLEKHSCLETGISIHNQLDDREVAWDVVLANALVNMYCKCGSIENAKGVFDNVNTRDVFLWNTLLLGYVENGDPLASVKMFTRMDCEPDALTYLSVLKACGTLPSFSFGKCMHAEVCRLGLEQDLAFATTLMEFYARCGCMTIAQELFDSTHSSDIISWTTLISGYCKAGESFRVFGLVTEMQEAGVEMDSITFTCVLTSCSHAGLVQEAKLLFESVLRSGIRLSVEQYNCMVDVLGRADRLDDALALVKSMPLEANGVTWTTLLGACVKWKNVEVGKVAFGALAKVKNIGR